LFSPGGEIKTGESIILSTPSVPLQIGGSKSSSSVRFSPGEIKRGESIDNFVNPLSPPSKGEVRHPPQYVSPLERLRGVNQSIILSTPSVPLQRVK
jgi:hypothetical protein